MQISPEIFRAYDIRGIVPGQLDAEGAAKIAVAFYSWLKKNGGNMKLAVGHDGRLTSGGFKFAVLEALKMAGAQVDDLGLCSTPTFYYGVAKGGYVGGLQISASHNPKEWNGLKLVVKNAVAIGLANGLAEVRDLVHATVEQSPAGGEIAQKFGVADEAAKDYVAMFEKAELKPFRVVADTANGTGSLDLEALFAKIPGSLQRLNFAIDGNFPAHAPDPSKPENLAQLQHAVLDHSSDLGIGLDGDADRIFFVDELGQVVAPQVLRAFLASLELEASTQGRLVVDVRPGRTTQDVARKFGTEVFVSPVGHANIKSSMVQHGAVFAGESSGHFFYKLPWGTFEAPMLVILKVLKYLSISGKTLSQALQPYDAYCHSGEISLKVASSTVVKRAIDLASQAFPESAQSHLDGLSVDLDDVWFNIRASNTEPLLRFAVEGKSEEVVAATVDQLKTLVRQAML